MDLDTGFEALDAHSVHGVVRVEGCRVQPREQADAATDLGLARTPGTITIDSKTQEFGGDGDLAVFAGETLTDLSEIITAVVAYYNEAAARMFVIAVDGAEALTSAGAVAPTDAEIAAALPDATYRWIKLAEATFARSGTAISLTIDHTVRPFGAVQELKAVAAGASEDPVDDGDLYRHEITRSISVDAADIADGDVLTEAPVPAFRGRILGWQVICETAITTAAKTTDLNLEINDTDVAGTATTYTGVKALGAVDELDPPTAGHASAEFEPGDSWSIEAANTTAFTEGRVQIAVDFGRKIS